MKKLKKSATLLLTLALVMATGLTTYANNESTPVVTGNTNPYIYEMDSQYWYQYRSPHRYGFTEYGEDGKETEKHGYAPAMYRLTNINTGEPIVGYCCDLQTSINTEDDIKYKRLNLEEAGYYSAENAKHIRGILQNGYWNDGGSTAEEQSAKLLQLATAAKIPSDETLTAAEALTATQHAIWYYANGGTAVTDMYEKSTNANSGTHVGHIFDIDTVNVYENLGPNNSSNYSSTVEGHIQKVYDYLIKVTATEPSSVIWNFAGQGVVVSAKVEEDGNISYTADVRFKMTGSSDETNGLTLIAEPIMKSGVDAIPVQKIALSDLTSENDYYTITFEKLTQNQIQGIQKIKFTLDGTQEVKNDVYFYEPEGGRKIAQCFVGFASGETSVHREWEMSVSMTEKSLSLFKHENDSETPISGAKFQLYAKIVSDSGTISLPIGEVMTTDENGSIKWTVLASADNVSYYCVETEAAPGYKLADDNNAYAFDSDGKVDVSNIHDAGYLVINKTVAGESSDQHFKFKVEVDFSKATLNDKLTDAEKTISNEEIEWSTSCDSDLNLHPEIEWTSTGDIRTAYIELANDESLTIKNLPVGTTYKVTELDANGNTSKNDIIIYNGISYMPSDNEISDSIKSDANEIGFINQKYEKDSITINGKKYLDDKESSVPFEFCLAELNDDGSRGTTLQTVINDENGNFAFESIEYSEPGIYRYQVLEKFTLGGYIFDTSVYNVEVNVQMDNETHKLIAAKTITIPSTSEDSEIEPVSDIQFRNKTRTTIIEYDNVTVTKQWKLDNGGKSQPVQVQLLKDGSVYDTVTLSENTGWTYTWNNLVKGPKWTVREVNIPDGFVSTITESGNHFIITNDDQGKSLTVNKEWKLSEDASTYPVEVHLLKDGQFYEKVMLSEDNNWTYTWTDLDISCEWTAEEVNVKDGFVSNTETDGDVITIVNTSKTTTDENKNDTDNNDSNDNSKDQNQDDDTTNPDTGDHTNIIALIIIIISSSYALRNLIARKKTQK